MADSYTHRAREASVTTTSSALGHVAEVVRYPVKSMAGCPTEAAELGSHGLDGDRRFAFRRLDDRGGFPWLSASRLPGLLRYHPVGLDERTGEPLPTHVRTPEGAEHEVRGDALRQEIAERFGSGVEMMLFKHGIFDDGAVSVISTTTVAGICDAAGVPTDARRFRANIVVASHDGAAFGEDGWVGGRLVFGDVETGPAVFVTSRDVRCMMINLDPDTAEQHASVMKSVVRMNDNHAGVYGTVVRTGPVRVGDPVTFLAE